MAPMRLVALFVLFLLTACTATGGLTGDQVAGVVVGGTSAFVLFVQDLLAAGVIDPATAAKLMASAGAIRDITEATRGAIAPIADAIGKLKEQADATWTGPEVAGGLGAASVAAVGAVRALRGPAASRSEKARRIAAVAPPVV